MGILNDKRTEEQLKRHIQKKYKLKDEYSLSQESGEIKMKKNKKRSFTNQKIITAGIIFLGCIIIIFSFLSIDPKTNTLIKRDGEIVFHGNTKLDSNEIINIIKETRPELSSLSFSVEQKIIAPRTIIKNGNNTEVYNEEGILEENDLNEKILFLIGQKKIDPMWRIAHFKKVALINKETEQAIKIFPEEKGRSYLENWVNTERKQGRLDETPLKTYYFEETQIINNSGESIAAFKGRKSPLQLKTEIETLKSQGKIRDTYSTSYTEDKSISYLIDNNGEKISSKPGILTLDDFQNEIINAEKKIIGFEDYEITFPAENKTPFPIFTCIFMCIEYSLFVMIIFLLLFGDHKEEKIEYKKTESKLFDVAQVFQSFDLLKISITMFILMLILWLTAYFLNSLGIELKSFAAKWAWTIPVSGVLLLGTLIYFRTLAYKLDSQTIEAVKEYNQTALLLEDPEKARLMLSDPRHVNTGQKNIKKITNGKKDDNVIELGEDDISIS